METQQLQLDFMNNEEDDRAQVPIPPYASSYQEWRDYMMSQPYPGSPLWTPEMEAKRQKGIRDVNAYAEQTNAQLEKE